MEHGGLLPPPLALHLFPRAGITRAVPPGRLAPGFTAAPAAPSLPPLQWHSLHLHAHRVMGRHGRESQTPNSIATGVLLAHACAASALAILLLEFVASYLADYYYFNNGVPHATTNPPPDGETLHATWANPGVTTRRFETGSFPTQLWAIHSWTECLCKIGRSRFQLPIASALASPPGQTREIAIRGA